LSFLLILCIIPYCLGEAWTVYVYTGNERFAGTDSNVYIRLFNSEGESTSEVQLTHHNWIPENNDFPIRNLFEVGARERFNIRTEYIGSAAKIQIRHNQFPTFQADWLLEQVIVERNRDGAKYIFKCNCWLRRGHPYITISALPDQRTIDQNKIKYSYSKNNRGFVMILISLITSLVCLFCCYNEYRRRQRHHSPYFNDTIEQIREEPSLLDTNYPETPNPTTPSSRPQLWINTIRRWKNFRNELPSYSPPQTTQTAAAAPTAQTTIPADEPPAYEDLYPHGTTPTNAGVNSNL